MPEWRHAGAVVVGTAAERAVFDTTQLRPSNQFFETDTPGFALWDGTGWAHRFVDNIILLDDAYIGLGPAAGRITFDATPAVDQVQIDAADLTFDTLLGIIHPDAGAIGVGALLTYDGVRFVPAAPPAAGPHNLLSATHPDTVVQAPSRGSLIYGDATPDWNELVHPAAAGYALTTDANDVLWDQTPNWSGLHTFDAGLAVSAGQGITMADDVWIGLGAGTGHIAFDSTPAPDQIHVNYADLTFDSGLGIIHPDAAALNDALLYDGTRFVPSALPAAAPHAILGASHSDAAVQAVSRGSLIYGDATPQWNELVHPAAAGYALTTDANDVLWDQTPNWSGLHTFDAGLAVSAGQAITMADDVWIGLAGPAGRLVFDATPAPDVIYLADANLSLDGFDLLVDSDRDSYIHEVADDRIALVMAGATGQLDVNINGADDFIFTANVLTVSVGSDIVMGDGCSIGQAAGPLVEFDDTLNYLEITGCFVGINQAAPAARLTVTEDGAATPAVRIENDDDPILQFSDMVDGVMYIWMDETTHNLYLGAWAAADLVVETGSGGVGINTATIPHGGVGAARLAIEGTDQNVAGPHVQLTTDADDYPLMQLWMWRHDNLGIAFDAYYDGNWRSSDAGSNFIVYKSGDVLNISVEDSIAAGNVVTWVPTLQFDTALHLILPSASQAIRGTGTNVPTLGTTTLAQKWGHIYLGQGREVFPDHDEYGLWARAVQGTLSPSEHWPQGADELAWTGWAGYVGYANPPANIARARSSLYVSHGAATHAFYYMAAYTANACELQCRGWVTATASAGVMVDDGVDAADGQGANNFARWFVSRGAVGSNAVLRFQYRTGGGAVNTVVRAIVDPGHGHNLLLLYGIGTRWANWAVYVYLINEYGLTAYEFAIGTFAWTPARVGVYYYGGAAARSAGWDWYNEYQY